MIIGLTLTILLVMTLISIIFGDTFASGSIETELEFTSVINGTTTTVDLGGEDVLFAIDPIQGAIAILIVLTVIAALLGARILATGLSDASVKIIMTITFYTGIWSLLSVLAIPLIESIEVFGSLIYISLTIMFAIGVMNKMAGGDSEV